MMEVFTLAIDQDLDVFHLTSTTPYLTLFYRLDELGPEAAAQHLGPDGAVPECRVLHADPLCRTCGAEGIPRDTITWQLAHEPFGHRPTTLLVQVRRYLWAQYGRTWRHNSLCLGSQQVLATFDGVAAIRLDEYVWRHTRRGNKFVTVIVDLTPICEKTGPVRLLDMVADRFKQVFKDWLASRPQAWRDSVESSRCMDALASRPQPVKSSRTRSRSWILSCNPARR